MVMMMIITMLSRGIVMVMLINMVIMTQIHTDVDEHSGGEPGDADVVEYVKCEVDCDIRDASNDYDKHDHSMRPVAKTAAAAVECASSSSSGISVYMYHSNRVRVAICVLISLVMTNHE